MSRQQSLLTLRRLCGADGETYKLAMEYYDSAEPKTGRGSGFDLKDLSGGLAAACAWLATQETKSNSVSFDSARNAACLNKVPFEKCVDTVRKALEHASRQLASPQRNKRTRQPETPQRRTRSSLPVASEAILPSSPTKEKGNLYAKLIEQYKLGESFDKAQCLNWCQAAQEKFIQAGRKNLATNIVFKHAVFYWVYRILIPNGVDRHDFVANHHDAMKEFLNGAEDAYQKTAYQKTANFATQLDELLHHNLRDDLVRESKRRSQLFTSRISPSKSPAKRELPSTDSPNKKQKLSTDDSQSQMATEEMTPNTPSRPRPQRAVASPTKPIFPQKSPTKLRQSPMKKQSLEKSDSAPALAKDADEDGDVEMQPPPQTPSKTRRGGNALRESNLAASSSKQTLDTLQSRSSNTSSSRPSLRHTSPSKSPSKLPAKRATVTFDESAMQVDVLVQDAASSDEGEEEETCLSARAVQRRFRPVFLDRKQWAARDPRLESRRKELVEGGRRIQRRTSRAVNGEP